MRQKRGLTRAIKSCRVVGYETHTMSRYGHNSDYEHGRRDYESRGAYGYDLDRYVDRYDRHTPWGTEARDYTEGFDEARREEEWRQERREEEAVAQRAEEARLQEALRQEEAYYWWILGAQEEADCYKCQEDAALVAEQEAYWAFMREEGASLSLDSSLL